MKFKVLITSMIIVCLIFCGNVSPILARVTTTTVNDATLLEDPDNPGNKVTAMHASVKGIASAVEDSSIVKAMAKLARWIICKFMELIGTVFALVGITDNTTLYFPQPTHIVYNMMPFFDPNFIDPAQNAGEGKVNLIQVISKAVAPMYVTSITIVTSAFVIVALFIGIKLAISVSAQQKAIYKSAIGAWLTGIVILYAGHFFMAGVFYLNEEIVKNLYQASATDQLKVFIPMYDQADYTLFWAAITAAAGVSALLTMINPVFGMFGVALGRDLIEGSQLIRVYGVVEYGYEGIFDTFLQKSALGDIMSTILIGVLAGQTLSLVILYTKRLFFCIVLGMILPYVVLVDTIKKVVGGKGGLLEKWLMQFTTTVFMQSIHAFIMTFSLYFMFCLYDQGIGIHTGAELKTRYENMGLYKLETSVLDDGTRYLDGVTSYVVEGEQVDSSGSNMSALIALVQFATIMSLTKIDGILKDMLGLQTSMAGDMKSAGRDSLMGLAAVRHAGKRIGDNFSGVASSTRKIRGIRNQMNTINEKTRIKQEEQSKKDQLAKESVAEGAAIGGTSTTPSGIVTNISKADEMKVLGGALDVGLGATGAHSTAINELKRSIDSLATVINNKKSSESSNKGVKGIDSEANQKIREMDEKAQMKELKSQLKAEQRNFAAKGMAAIATPSIILAGTAVGAGAESKEVAAAIISAGDMAAEAIGKATQVTANLVGAGDVTTRGSERSQELMDKIKETTIKEHVIEKRISHGGVKQNKNSSTENISDVD